MTVNATPEDRELALAPLDEKADHVRGSPAGHLIIEYGDYECPYSRQAFHAIEQVEARLDGNIRFAFRHFPLTSIHPHALAAAAAAEAAALHGHRPDSRSRCLSGARTSGLLHSHAPAADAIHPVLHRPGVADHQDLVTTSHLARSNPGSTGLGAFLARHDQGNAPRRWP